MRAKHATEIRRGITDAKDFVAKARGISRGYIFFHSSDGTLHGRAFQRSLRRISTRGLYHCRRHANYTDGTTKYVNRLYSKAPSHIDPDWYNA